MTLLSQPTQKSCCWCRLCILVKLYELNSCFNRGHTSIGYEPDILSSYLKTLVSHSLTSLLPSFDSVFHCFNSLPECFLKWPLLLLLNILDFDIFIISIAHLSAFLNNSLFLIAYLSAFSNNTFVVLIFSNDLLSWYSWLTSLCFFNSLCVLVFVLDNSHNHDFLEQHFQLFSSCWR